MQEIFAAADELHARSAFSLSDRAILDDHAPLNDAQIPTIDLIGFDYPYWHTADDTMDKLSPESLQTVGAVTLRWLKTASGQRVAAKKICRAGLKQKKPKKGLQRKRPNALFSVPRGIQAAGKALVAQLDRASDYGSEGFRFDS